jgi:branched-chain amino acid transport system substrate-binding protein
LGGAAGALVAGRLVPVRAQANDAIRIGFQAPLSGANAPVGQPNLLGAQIAADQINGKGGVNGRKIELVILDDKGDPSQAVANAHEFSSRGINLFLGPATTGSSMGVGPLLPDLKAVQLGLTTTDERLTHELYNGHFFATVENTYTRSNAFAEAMAKRYPEITSWTGAIWDAAIGHDYWTDVTKALQRHYSEIAKKEVTIIDPVFSKTGTTDFKIQISQLLQAKADGLVTILSGSDGITFYKQILPFGLDKKFKLFVDEAIDINLPKALGNSVRPNIWISSFWYADALKNNRQGQELHAEVVKRTGELPHGFVGVGHTAMTLYAAAIQQASSTDTDKVIAALETIQVDTVKGPTHFRKEDHQIIADSFMFSVKPKESGAGFETNDTIVIPMADVVNPAAPGTKWSP